MKDTNKKTQNRTESRGGVRPWSPPSSGYFATLALPQEAVVAAASLRRYVTQCAVKLCSASMSAYTELLRLYEITSCGN